MDSQDQTITPTSVQTIGKTYTWIKYSFNDEKPLLGTLNLELDNATQLIDYPHEKIRVKFAVKRSASLTATLENNYESYIFDLSLDFDNRVVEEPRSPNSYKVTVEAGVKGSKMSQTPHNLRFLKRVLKSEQLYKITQDEFNLPSMKYWMLDNLKIGIRRITDNEYGTDSYSTKDTIVDILRKGLYSDLSIRVGNHTFPAHKSIISLKSPVFKAIFSYDEYKIEQNSIMYINDFNASVIKALLTYIYTGQVYNLNEVAEELFFAAHKYQVHGLLHLCDMHTIERITLANFVEVLQTSEWYDRPLLKQHADAFVRKHEDKVVQDMRYQEFLCNDLRKETVLRTLELCVKYDLQEVKAVAFQFLKANKNLINRDFLRRFGSNTDFMEEMFSHMIK